MFICSGPCLRSAGINTRNCNKIKVLILYDHVSDQSSNQPVLIDFSLTVKAAPRECVIRTSQP